MKMAMDAANLFSRSLSSATASASDTAEQANQPTGSGFLVCLDVPEGTEFGVDYEVFRTGPKFQGVKFVPLGLHFVFFRSKDHDHGVRQGFFVRFGQDSQVIVREWSATNEELGRPRAGLNIENLERAVRSFQLDAGLGAYPKQHFKIWRRLSKYIGDDVLKRCGLDYGGMIVPGDVDSADVNTNPVVPYFPDQPRTAVFTAIRGRDLASMTVQERTQYHIDRSTLLSDIISGSFSGSWQALLGELQLSFLLFLQLSSLAALEQWKKMTHLLCSCDTALVSAPLLFTCFIKTLRTQLQQIPVDFFDEELTEENFLRPCLVSLAERLQDNPVTPELSRERDRLVNLLHDRFKLALPTMADDDEYAPTVVQMEESVDENEDIALAFLRSRNRLEA